MLGGFSQTSLPNEAHVYVGWPRSPSTESQCVEFRARTMERNLFCKVWMVSVNVFVWNVGNTFKVFFNAGRSMILWSTYTDLVVLAQM